MRHESSTFQPIGRDASRAPGRGSGRRGGLALAATLTLAVLTSVFAANALADPAGGPGLASRTSAGALATGVVPDGTCQARVTAVGGGGASSTAGGGATGGVGGAGARISATFDVVPGQAYSGSVGGGGAVPAAGTGNGAVGAGGAGGTAAISHLGGGGGGRTSVSLAGAIVVIAGGGGGGGAAHQNNPAGVGGGAGFSGIAPGAVAVGSDGQNGSDGTNTSGGGKGGAVAAGGLGGLSTVPARSGAAGGGIGVGTGGNGGPDDANDSAGGGGGGYTGGGGGAATVTNSATGAGGGGGSSWVAATSPVAAATAPTAVTGAAGPATPTGSAPGAAGSISIDWLPCIYELSVAKSVSAATVMAGDAVTWTVTVTNTGPGAMTKGDTVDLTDTLPPGPNGVPGPAYKVTSFAVSGGANAALDRGPVTCSGLSVGAAMPPSTTCSRPYSAPTAPDAPSGGLRGLDPGETITITYEQIVANTAPCATIVNVASVKDRSTQTGTTDIVGVIATRTVNVPLTIVCYDLAVTKTVDPTSDLVPGGDVTWTVTVTNNGPASMEGPVDTTANPLVVTDAFPLTDLGAPTLISATGPAGSCSLSGSTVTCAAGIAVGAEEVLTFHQAISESATVGASIANTAAVADPASTDSNDTSLATATLVARPVSATPVSASADAASTLQGTPVTVNPLANDVVGSASVDPTTVLLRDPADGTFKATVAVPGEGTYTVNPTTGAITFAPERSFTGTALIAYRVTDGNGLVGQSTLAIGVTPVTPTLTPDVVTGSGTGPVVIPVLANDASGNSAIPLDPSTLQVFDPADGTWKAAVTVTGEGTYTVDPATGSITFVPAAGFSGRSSIRYRVADKNGQIAEATVSVAVAANASLAVTKRYGQSQVRRGATTSTIVVVRNTSGVTATNVVVCDVPGASFAYVALGKGRMRSGRLCWTIPSIAPGRSVRLVARVRVLGNAPLARIVTRVLVQGANANPARASAAIRVRTAAGVRRGPSVTG